MKHGLTLVGLFFLLSGFTFSGGDANSKEASYHIVGKSRVRFIKLYHKANERSFFFYEQLTSEILAEFAGAPYGTGGHGCPGDKTLINFASFDYE